ncbi:MAG: hypothetical protein HY808_15420 [Nitrospirae bacterium]|nr:hypothetical protein [Nitrospirota bacterium]
MLNKPEDKACEVIDEKLITNLKHAERLRQSILKKAFSGRLVEQEKNYNTMRNT